MHCGSGGVFADTLVGVGLVRVVPTHVLDHLELLLGLIAAEAAEEWVAIGMGESMMSQSSSPAESTVANIANVGFGLTVLSEVGAQQEASLECLAALLTHESPCLSVPCLPVYTQCVSSVGAVLTLRTLVWLQSCVLGHVVLELVDPLALVSTLRAQVLPFLLMDPHVVLQARRISTGIGAEVTAVRLFPSVDAAVPGDLLPIFGAIGTVGTLVEPGTSMSLYMVIKHQLMATCKVTKGAAKRGLAIRRGC